MKKRVISAVCATAMLAGIVPVPAFAVEPPEGADLKLVLDVTDANGDGYVSAGEDVTMTLSIQDAGWANNENKLPFTAGNFIINFDNSLLELVGDPATPQEPYVSEPGPLFTGTDAIYTYSDNGNEGLEKPNEDGLVAVLIEWALRGYVDLPDEKTPLFTFHFVAKEDVEGTPTFSIDPTSTMELGYISSGSDAVYHMTDPDPDAEINAALTVDTLAPTITLEGGQYDGTATFYYQPIAVAATDNGSGLASLTLDGTAVDGTVTTGGTLVATDNQGNSSSIVLTVDSTDYDAARAAAEALPETITYTDKTAIDNAQAALDAVTDSAASAKLADVQAVVTAAAAAWHQIDARIDTVEGLIDDLPAVKDLTLTDVEKLNAIESQIDELAELGVTPDDISNYADYEAACDQLAAVRAEINAVKEQIDQLPDADHVGYGDEAAVKAAAQALEALCQKYSADADTIRSTVGADRLTAIQTSLANLNQELQDLIGRIASTSYNITMYDDDIAVITGLRAEVDAMTARGATFTEEDLQPLVNAETALAELRTQSAAAHAAIAELPAADDVLYTDRDAVADARAKMNALDGKDTFSAEETRKLEAAEAVIQEIDADIAEVKTEIADKLGSVTTDTTDPEDIQAVQQIQQKIEALSAQKVPTDAIEGYATYVSAKEAVQPWLDKIDAVETAAADLEKIETITFRDREKVEQMKAALQELTDRQLDSLVDKGTVAVIQSASADLEALDESRAQLVKDIADTQLTISLKDSTRNVITGLRARVSEMEELGTTFTTEELQNLTAAEADQAALDARSAEAHDALAGLPARDEVLYTAQSELTDLETELQQLTGLGDVFTADEQRKLNEAQAGIADMKTAAQTLGNEMLALKDPTDEQTPVQYADEAALQDLNDRIAALRARQCDVWTVLAADENDTYTDAPKRYEAYSTAVNDMVKELDSLNAEMTEALKDWTYGGDTTAFDDLRDRMDTLAVQYGIDGEQVEEAFPDYMTSTRRDEAAKALLEEAAEDIAALPSLEQMTLNNSNQVNKITALLKQLKDSYGFNDAMLDEQLGDAYATYLAAAKKMADLGRPTQTGDSTANGTQTPTSTAASTAAPTATPAPASTAAPASTTAVAQIPQTADPLNLQMVMILLVLSMGGLAAGLVARRKRSHHDL